MPPRLLDRRVQRPSLPNKRGGLQKILHLIVYQVAEERYSCVKER
jgi:hypothetical protein